MDKELPKAPLKTRSRWH